MAHALAGATAVCGLGMTEMGKVYGRNATDFAVEAVMRALDDAGLAKSELDGLLINAGITRNLDLPLANALGLQELSVLTQMNAYGSSAGQMLQYASMAVHNGLANYVACVFADDPLREGERAGAVYSGLGAKGSREANMYSLYRVYGYTGAIPFYAMSAQRHMDLYGSTQSQLGQIAISTREWAANNPRAAKRTPLTMEQYDASPWARDLQQPPVYVRGVAQAHNLDGAKSNKDVSIHGPGQRAAKTLFAMADATVDDVTMCQLYDCYTYTVLATLEDYGFCDKGEGGAFVADGKLGPGGSLPTNTGGGELSSYYMWGMTPISEGVLQGRGNQGARQVEDNELILVTGNGGMFTHHASLLLSPNAS